MQTALSELSEMDNLAAQSSAVHSLHPAAKLIATIAYILITLSFDKYNLSGLAAMVLWPVFLFALSGIKIKTCFYKLRIVLPLVIMVGIFNPLFDKAPMLQIYSINVPGGVISMLTLMLKGIFSLMASFLLMATTPIDNLCSALRRFHVPQMIVTLFLLTYRYVGVLMDELSVMTDAYHLRAPRQKGIQFSAWGSFLGQLLLRSMDRAQELYSAMLLRGYHGHFHYADIKPFETGDAIYTAACIVFFLLLRYINVAELLGGLIT